jgi:hypothetical protein
MDVEQVEIRLIRSPLIEINWRFSAQTRSYAIIQRNHFSHTFKQYFYLFPYLQTKTAAAPAAGSAKDKAKNVMRDLKIRKLCLNICVGESGDRLTRAAKVKTLKVRLKEPITKLSFPSILGVGATYRPTARLLQGPLHSAFFRHP